MELLWKLSKFSKLRILSWCVMSNHIHLLIQVPEREPFMSNFTEEDLWEHLKILYDEIYIKELRDEVEQLRKNGATAAAEEILENFRKRMFNVSAFWQQLKRRFTRWYNFVNERRGTLWEGRFRSTLVEETREALSAVAAYIDLNPVRAGMVEDPADYPLSSYGSAVGGNESAQRGLMRTHDLATLEETRGKNATLEEERFEKGDWEEFAPHYRMLLYGEGMEIRNDEGGVEKRGFSSEEVEEVEGKGGALSLSHEAGTV